MLDESEDNSNNRSNKTSKSKDPLHLSDSNWLVEPVDDSPASLPTYDSVSNLNVLNEIKHYTLLTAVPGNALNNTRSINETEAKTSAASDTSVISCSSIDAYP